MLPSGTGLQSPTKSLIGDIVSSPQRDPQLESLRANCKQESGIRSDSGCNPDAEPVFVTASPRQGAGPGL
ncbi:hypothetical protein H2136_18755 [Aeromonas hydrophila]|uniref:Uncharacterized protein n=1 Tax=Aeromonas hydrophila TaxID=644 RepID=A0A926IYQ2_AERHY|nr:hypothetical protein [Aeromonas hydrophila]